MGVSSRLTIGNGWLDRLSDGRSRSGLILTRT
jgi:hypothetical protein